MTDVIELPDATLDSFPTRAEWLDARRSYGIGSSDVPAILGISRFQSPLSLYHEKLGVKAESEGSRDAREWGLILEEPIAQRYALKTGRTIVNPNAGGAWTIARSTARPWMIASVDRFALPAEDERPTTPPGVLEIKNAHLFMADLWGPENNNEPPVEYQVQLQHQLAVTGLRWGSIAALIGGVRFVWADIPRDEELIAKLIEIEGDFRARLIDRHPPEADGSESTRELLKKLYPRDTGEVVELSIDALEWHHELQHWKGIEKVAKQHVAEFENKIKAAIGGATAGTIPGGITYTHKLQRRAGYTVEPTEFRVLRLQGGGKGKGAA